MFGAPVSDFLKSLQQPEYVHVLLNHVPLTGLFSALLGLIGGLIFRKRALLFLGLTLVSLFSLSAWPVSEYGEQGYDRVLAMSDDAGRACLERHRDLAGRWVFLFYVAAGAGVVALVAGWKWPKSLWPASLGVAVLAASSLVAGTVIAEWGGRVRHREFRPEPAPAAALTRTFQTARPADRRSADFQSAVSRVSNPLSPTAPPTLCRLEVGDTAGWKPALRAFGAPGH